MLVVLVLVPAATAVTFGDHAFLDGSIMGRSSWILMATPNPLSNASLEGHDVIEANHRYIYERITDPADVSDGDGLFPAEPAGDERHHPAFAASLANQGWTVLYIEGDLLIQATGKYAVSIDDSSMPGQATFAANSGRGTVRPGMPAGAHVGIAVHQARDVAQVHIHGEATLLEFHGVRPSCATSCPRPALKDTTRVGFVEAGTTDFSVLTGGMSIDLAASPSFVIWGAPQMDLNVNGTARLPLAYVESCPGTCESGPDGTVTVAGDFALRNVSRQGNQLEASLSGRIDRLMLDESTITERDFNVPVVVAAGGVFLGLLGAVLVSKKLLADPLRNLRRERIYELVRSEPGLNFRQIQRRLKLAHGNLHYHVFVMEQAGILRSETIDGRRAFAIDAYAVDLAKASALNNPALRRLYHELGRAPNLASPGLRRELARRLGWPESTTRHRLARLRASGLLRLGRDTWELRPPPRPHQ